MTVRTFIDTNVLVYAEAADMPSKQTAALQVLRQLYESATGVLSTQVLQEYSNIALKKLKLSPQYVRSQLDLYEQFEVIQVTPVIIRFGIDLHQTRSIGLYDAIMVASASTAGCKILLSEDLNAGEIMNGVKIVDPFADT